MKSKFISLFLAFIIGIMSFGVVFARPDDFYAVTADGESAPARNNSTNANTNNSNAGGSNIYDTIGKDLNGDISPIKTPVENVLGVIQLIGFVVAIVMVMYVGIKYLAAGAGQKAEVKSTMVPMLVGAAMVGLAPTLVKWIFGIFA